MKNKSRLIALGFFLVGCINLEGPTPSTQTQLVVHSVLDPSVGVQSILIYRARTGVSVATNGGISDDEPVTGALVTVTMPNGDTVTASEGDQSSDYVPGRYRYSPGFLQLSGTYVLNVRTSLGEEVSGTTIIPNATPSLFFVTLNSDFRRLRDTLRLNWARVPGAGSYEVIVKPAHLDEYRVFTDTAVVLPGNMLTLTGDMVFPPGVSASVLIIAVDANYYDYYRAQSDPFAGAAPSHLQGAMGVFGSIVPIRGYQVRVR